MVRYTAKHRYDWIPDIPDHRDFKFKPRVAVAQPDQVDLRSKCTPVRDQGQLGSCTGFACTGLLEYLHYNNATAVDDFVMSPLFQYYNERVIEHDVRQDAGASIRDGMRAMNYYGVCTETSWPYNVVLFARKPSRSAYTNAKKFVITQYNRLVTLDDKLNCLAQGEPFVFGFSVYESFESDQVAQSGVVPMPGPNEQLLGGHAVVGVGYDKANSWFIVKNSWGPGWGQQGYFVIPFAYLNDTNLSDDFWTAQR